MHLGPQITDQIAYPEGLSRIIRIDRSVGLIFRGEAPSFWLFAPFSMNRGMSGMQYLKLNHDTKADILNVCGLWAPSDLAIDSVDAFDVRGLPEFNILIYDSESWFSVVDPARRFVSARFKIPGIDGPVIRGMTGNMERVGELVVVTPREVHVYLIESANVELRKTHEMAASSIIAFNDGYLMIVNNELVLLRHGEILSFYKERLVEQFVVDRETVVSCRFVVGGQPQGVFSVVGGASMSVRSMKEPDAERQMFDVADGLMAILVPQETLVIVKVHDTVKRIQMNVPLKDFGVKYCDILRIACGVNRAMSVKGALVVMIFAVSRTMVMEIPLAIMDEE